MRSEFVRLSSRLFSWTVAGQLIGLLSAPVVARLYLPEFYGVATLVITVASTLAIVAALRFEQAIVIADTDDDARQLERVSLYSVLTVGLVSLAVGAFVFIWPTEGIREFFGERRFLILAVPVLTVLAAMANISRKKLSREKNFSQVGVGMFVNSVTVPVSRIVTALLTSASSLLLVVGSLLGWLLELFTLRSKVGSSRVTHSPPGGLASVAKRYRDFPLFSLPEGFVSNISIQLPVFALGAIYSPAVVGMYALAVRLIRLPTMAVSTSVSQVLVRTLKDHSMEGKSLVRPVVLSTLGLFAIAGAVGVGIFFFATPVLTIFLGENWGMTGPIAKTLVPWIVGGVAIIPTNMVLIVERRQGLWLAIQSGLLLIRLAIFIYAALAGLEVIETLWLFSLSSAGYYLATFLGVLWRLRSGVKNA